MIWPSVHPGLVVKSTLFISNPMAATLKGLSDAVGVRGNGSKGVRQNAGPWSCLCYCNCMKTIRKVIEEDNNSTCRQLLFAMMHEATKEKNASASDVCALFTALLLYNSQDLLHKISFKLCSTLLFSLPSCFVFFFFFFLCVVVQSETPSFSSPPAPAPPQPPHQAEARWASGGSTKMTEWKTTQIVQTLRSECGGKQWEWQQSGNVVNNNTY